MSAIETPSCKHLTSVILELFSTVIKFSCFFFRHSQVSFAGLIHDAVLRYTHFYSVEVGVGVLHTEVLHYL